MHFRERGNAIQLVRTAYDPEKKGAKSEIIGRVPRKTREVPEDLKQKLTAEELAALDTYLQQTKAIEELGRKVTAHTLRQTVAEAIEYAQGVTDEAERDQLQAIFADAILALRRASQGEGKGGKAGPGRRRGAEARQAAD